MTEYGFALAGDASSADGYESRECEIFLELLQCHDIVFDIGANIGFYSCLAAIRGKRVLAFEPAPRNLKFLHRNLGHNQFSGVEVLPIGLAGSSGTMRIYGYAGTASFVKGWAHTNHFTVVPVETLDSIVCGRFGNERLLVKMDVEGFELEVLRGALKTLSLRRRPTWLVEIMLDGDLLPDHKNPKFRETFELFWSFGYESTLLDSQRTPIDSTTIDRWIALGGTDNCCHDFIFSKPDSV